MKIWKTIGKYAIWTVGGLILSLALSLVYYSFLSVFISTDVEKHLAEENRIYRERLPQIDSTLSLICDEVDYLRQRDEDIYRNVFSADAPLVDKLIENDIFADKNLDRRNVVSRTYEKSSKTMKLASDVEDDWKAISAILENGRGHLPPLSSPIRNLGHTNVGASVGMKMNPFYKTSSRHNGLDLIAPVGTPVLATTSGYVTNVMNSKGGQGNMVEITNADGYVTRYAHLDRIDVFKGGYVARGGVIGTVGDSGRSFTTHLHYELLLNGQVLDPVHFILGTMSPDEYVNSMIMSASSGQSMD